jgi:hypothetical protein
MMSNKYDYSSFDFSQTQDSVPSSYGVTSLADIIAQLEEQSGTKLTDREREQVASAVNEESGFDITRKAKDPFDFTQQDDTRIDPFEEIALAKRALPVLPSTVSVAKEPASPMASYWDQVKAGAAQQLDELKDIAETAYGVIQRSIGSAIFTEAQPNSSPLSNVLNLPGEITTLIQAGAKLAGYTDEDVANKGADIASELYGAAGKHDAAGERLRKSLEGRGWLTEELGGGLIDAAKSPTSAVSLIGGPAGALAVGDAYAQAYYDARQNGVPEDQAKIYAWTQAAPESISAIPAGKLLERIPGLGPILKNRMKAVEEGLAKKLINPDILAAATVAKTAVGESIEEGVTGSLQDIATAAAAGQDHARELQSYADKQAPKSIEEFLSNRYRDMRAGLIMGAGGGTIESAAHYNEFQNQGKEQAATTTGRTLEGYLAETADTKKQADLRRLDEEAAQERQRQEQAKNDAFTRAESEAAQRKADETEATVQTVQRQHTADMLSQNPAMRVAPVAQVSAEEVQAERVKAEKAEAERLERVELGRKAEQLRKEQEAAPVKPAAPKKKAKPKAKPETDMAEQLRKQQLGRIHKTRKELGLDDAAYKDLLTKVTGKTSSKDMSLEERERVLEAMRHVKAGKPLSDFKPAPAVTQELPEPTTNDQDLEDADIRKMAEEAGIRVKPADKSLGMAAEGKSTDTKDFVNKVHGIFKALVKRNTQQTVDVQNIFRQQKAIMAPNPQSIGREDNGNVAEYDPKTNKMYVYTDNLPDGDTNIVPHMLSAIAGHEGTHFGQENTRPDRGRVLAQLMSKDNNNKVKDKIADQYRKDKAAGKSTIFTRAVDKAIKASDSEDIASLETPAYLVSEAVEQRGKNGVLGRAAAVVRDIKSAVRSTVRDKLGVDLDITLDEIESATQKVVGEVVKTDRTKTKGNTTLAMIGGKSATGYKRAVELNKAYPGFVDKLMRFEFSDSKSEILNEGVARVLTGESVPLNEFIKHDELYKQYPRIGEDLTVQIDKSLPPEQMGRVKGNRIYLNPAHLNDKNQLRLTMLHEIQHDIQTREGFIPGTAPHYFVPFNITARVNTAARKLALATDRFDLGRAISSLPPTKMNEWLRFASRAVNPLLTDKDTAAVFIDEGYAYDSKDQITHNQAKAYIEASYEMTLARAALEKAYIEATKTYAKDYGEAEARNTEFRADLTQEEIDADTNNPESTMRYADRKVDVSETIDTRNLRQGQTVTSPASLGMTKLPDNSNEKYEDFISSALRKRVMDEKGQDILDDIIEAGISPNAINKEFWHNTYWRLPAEVQQRFQRMLTEASGGVKPGLKISQDEVAEDWQHIADKGTDLPNEAEYLEGTDRGFVVLMHEANQRFPSKPNTTNHTLGMAKSPDGGPSVVPKEKLSIKETLRRVVDFGTRSQTSDIKFAEDLDSRYRRALKKDVGDKKKDFDSINEAIMTALTAVDNADPASRKKLWDGFKRRYPNLAPILQEMRDKIDANTKEYISTLLSSGRTLSKKEIKDIRTLLANQGRYLTRAYSAFQAHLGRKWGENRWADYKNKLNSYLDNPEGLSNKARKNVEEVLAAVNFLEKQLVIPGNDKLTKLTTDKLEQIYEDHIGPANRLDYQHDADDELAAKRAALISALATRRNELSPEHYNNMAEQVVKELLGLDEKTTNYARVFSDLARDPGTLKKRENIPGEIRRLLGEITNPGGVVLSTLSTQAALNARARVIHDMLTTQVGTLVLPPTRITEPGMRKKFPMLLKGTQYGQLDGYYATKQTARALTDTVEVYHTYEEALTRWNKPTILLSKLAKDIPRYSIAKLTRFEKIFSVVLRPYNWAGNFIGSPLNMLRSGNFSPTSALKGLRTGKDYIEGTLFNTTTELLEEAIKYVNIEAVDVAEMQRVLGDKIAGYMEGAITAENVTDFIDNKLSTRQKARRLGRTGLATYAMMDAWVKVANFYERVDTLSRYYKALGKDISAEDIKREAGDVTSYTNLSNERVPGWLKLPEQAGLTKFIPYFSETMRTTYTNFHQGFLDLERAARTENQEAANVLRSAAARRLIGSLLASAALPARFPMLTNLGLSMFGLSAFELIGSGILGGGDDDDAEKKRRMLSEFNRHQDMVQFGKDKDGNPVYLPISMRFDPNGPATDITRIFATTETNQETYDAIVKYMRDLLMTPTWIKHTLEAVTQNTVPQSTLAANFPAATDAAGDFMSSINAEGADINKALYMVDPLVPGMSWLGSPKYKVKLPENPDPGQEFAIKTVERLGGSFETLDAPRVLRSYGMEAEDGKKENRAKLTDNLMLRSEIDEDSFMDALTRYRVREQERYDIGRKSYESLQAWGYDDAKIKGMLVTAGWSKREAEDIVAGDDTTILSLRSLSDSKRGKSDEAKLEEILELINKHKKELEEIGIEVRKD